MTAHRSRVVVAALGGNALLRRGEPMDPSNQLRNIEQAAAQLSSVARSADLVVTHGNGPQVGLLAMQSVAVSGAAAFPLDVLGAETEGMIGYLIEQELGNLLPRRQIATLLTRVEVDPDDRAFDMPSKPIGPAYGEAEAIELAASRGWRIDRDGAGFRRVVASPDPISVLELGAISILLAAGCVVICAGGGGIPVCRTPRGFVGVEAVVDKDATAALLAEALHADLLMLLTDVDAVYNRFGSPDAEAVGHASPESLRGNWYPTGSMGPKVEAACRFVERTRGRAVIGRLEDAAELADPDGTCGTRVALG